jgi:hypothetical protein
MRYSAITLFLVALFAGCYREDDYIYTADEIFEHLEVDFAPDSIPADLSSTTVLTIKMPETTDTNLTKFNLKCSSCTFTDTDTDKEATNLSYVSGDENHRYVEVRTRASNSVGTATVTIELAGYEKRETFRLYEAEPTELVLSSPLDYVRNDTINEISLSALLKSATGLASKGVKVGFNVSFNPPYNGGNAFFFEEDSVGINASSVAGNIFLFQVDDTYQGDITLRAAVNTFIKDSLVIHVID